MKKRFGFFLIWSIVCLALVSCGKNPVDKDDTEEGEEVKPPSLVETTNTLVAYFSCTQTTEKIANFIATITNGDLFEIVPEVPYTEADLKYYTGCRADQEQADPTARPAIQNKLEGIENYDTVFLGYPIWHGQAPRIISTFLESYNFSGKRIIPFCTSQSSGIGSSDTNLHSLALSAEWESGKRFSKDTTSQIISTWIEELDLVSNVPQKPSQEENTDKEEITKMYININGNKVEITLEKNSSVDALIQLLKQGDITYTANDYGDFEKVGNIGHTLPRNDVEITTQAGDVILYQGNNICLYYGTNTWSFTRIGKIQGYTTSELRSLLGAGKGTISVTLSLKA